MPLIYRVDIVDNYIDMEADEDTDDGNDVSFETEEVSYNLNRPPGGAPILAKSEAVAAAEFRAIAKHKHFRTHIEHDDISPHDLHSLLDVFNSRRSVDVTIDLQRFGDEEDAIAFCNEYAPEHLQVLSKEPFAYLGRLENAGEILLGEHTPTTLGNFVVGPSHVLPTSGWARTASAISVFDFLKRNSIAYVTGRGYPELARHARALATYEGFEAHANAVSEIRDRILKR